MQATRIAGWAVRPERFPRANIDSSAGLSLQHQVSAPLFGVQSHPILEAGKRANLAIAAAHFDGRRIDAATPFSFWKILGRPVAARGFVPGTEVRDGCVVPTVGGGLCLISGALFRLAAEMGWDILERHGHTVQSSDIDLVDATVFWPQVDLRFAPRRGSAVLRVRIQDESLIVESFGARAQAPLRVWRSGAQAQNSNATPTRSRVLRTSAAGECEVLGVDHKRSLPRGLTRNCLTCNETGCSARKQFLQVVP